MTANKRTLHNDLGPVAIHEAAHAVIGRVLNLSCGSVTIVPNVDEGEAGCAIIHDPWKTAYDWDQKIWEEVEQGLPPSKSRNPRSAFRGTILARMAGAEAETVILGACQGGAGDDQFEIEAMAVSRHAEFSSEEWERYEPRMRRQTRQLIRRHRAKIERVAAALLARGTLEPEEVDFAMNA